MATKKQCWEKTNVGVVWMDASAEATEVERRHLVEWIMEENISVLTGSFAGHKKFVRQLAKDAGAVGDSPMYTEM